MSNVIPFKPGLSTGRVPVHGTTVALEEPTVVRLNSLAVCRLNLMQHWLDAPELSAFVEALMRDAELFPRFLTIPASKHDHHSYRGGLFVHSVDVAFRMFGSASIALEDKPLAVAAGLAHDLGKTLSLAGFGENGVEQHHFKLTLAALAPIRDALRSSHRQFVDSLAMIYCLRQDTHRPRDLPRRIDGLLEELLRADHLSRAEGRAPGSSGEPPLLDD
jgi:hypothetical protein